MLKVGSGESVTGMTQFTFLEFFAGGGMARAGLGDKWRCLFANDFDQKKVSTYEANWGAGDIKNGDVTSLTLADLPQHWSTSHGLLFPARTFPLRAAIGALVANETMPRPVRERSGRSGN